MKTKISPLFILVAAVCLRPSILEGQETVPQTQTILKSYFETGKIPQQTNFDEWIDTEFWYVNQIASNAAFAASNAAFLSSVSPIVGSFRLTLTNNAPGYLADRVLGFTNVSGSFNNFISYQGSVTNFFTAPMPDTNYGVNLVESSPPQSFLVTNQWPFVVFKQTNAVVVTFLEAANPWEYYPVQDFYFVVFK